MIFGPTVSSPHFGGIGDQFAHTRNSRFVDEIDDELEFVEAFEVGKLRRISGTNERIETGANERACSSAKDCLLTKKVWSPSPREKLSRLRQHACNRFPLPRPRRFASHACWDFGELQSGRAHRAL